MTGGPGSRPFLKRLVALGLPHAPLMLGVALASSVFSLTSSGMMWFLGQVCLTGSVLSVRLPSRVQALLPGEASGDGLSAVQTLCLGALGTLVIVAASCLRDLGSNRVVWRIVADLRGRLCGRFLGMDPAFFRCRSQGDLLSRASNDVGQVRAALTFLFHDMFQRPIDILLGASVLLALGYGRVVLVGLALALVMAWPIRLLGQGILKASLQGAGTLGEVTQTLLQILGGFRLIRTFHTGAMERRRFDEVNRRFLGRMGVIARAQAASGALMQFTIYGVFVTGGALLLTPGGVLAAFSPKDLGLCLLIGIPRILWPLHMMASAFQSFQASLPGVARVFEILALDPVAGDAPGAVPLPPFADTLAYEDVTFSYEGVGVLRHVNLRIRKGQRVAIVGPSGAGKSTLLDLLARLVDPQAGRITMDGRDLRTVTRKSLLDQLAIVHQDAFLFNATVRDNIAYGRPEATREEIEEAARIADLHDTLRKLPLGYDTPLGERGLGLSGGERQRLALARAILRKDATILVLDEATSALDSLSERRIGEALDRRMAGRTTLVVAQRLATVLHADLIVVLEAGGITAQGTHAELLARSACYRQLYDSQFPRSA